ncbi:MAG: Fic family protein [bacterium]|nr:Fic family protein [bacterium]
MDILDSIDELQQRIDALRPFPTQMNLQLRQFYRVGLTFSSNAIEGNSLTLSETKIVLEDGITVGGKPLKDHLEAIGHGRAFDFMWKLSGKGGKGNTHFNETEIKTLHRHLFQPLNPEEAGSYRKTLIIVTGSSFVFPTPGEVPGSMKEYVSKLPGIKEKFHPVVYAAKVHAHLVRIHPFHDGNGRIARLLMNLVLVGSGYPVTIIPPLRRVEYIDALEKSHLTGDDGRFIQLIGSCVKESQKELLRFFQ